MADFQTRVVAGPRSAITPARVAAVRVMRDVRAGGMLDSAIDSAAAELDTRDRRWLQELTYVTLRRRNWIDAVLSERVRGGLGRLHPDLCDLLRLGVTQLAFMGSVPAYAAIAQTVEQAKAAAGLGASKLANAVLRRVDRERDALEPSTPPDPLDAMALTHSHPRWLIARWVARWGADATTRLLETNNSEAHTILRPMGVVREQLEAMLDDAGVQTFEPALSPSSLALQHGVSLATIEAFKSGHCFVQDPAATMVSRYAAIAPGMTVADLCAAPGGKTFELARDARIVAASDASVATLARLAESLRRMDLPNVHAIAADARFPAVRPMDAVLLDAPCTGTGTFRRHPDARWRIKPSDLAVMAAVQRTLLESAAQIVAPGGLLVYSTCSLEQEENDAQVEAFLGEHDEFTLEPPPAGTVPAAVLDAGRLRVLPQLHGADGAFAARLRRRDA
ncbi:MAG: 16S rRNA (cytosine(967)-C(5))-methyltransferase RsmB [Gemmatimonadetes bacterium]|nr:16S rRNA (cytosine(967)-C(5))-methyltransferase RsmB [Gemmatimonadota bacterium]